MVDTTREKTNYIQLNAMVKRYDAEGKMQLDKDKEAARAYFLNHVNSNTVFHHDLEEKLNFLWDNEYYERELFDQYSFAFVKDLYKAAYAKKFRFQSFAGAFQFYNQYALKTFDGERYLERYEDRIVANALLLGGGDEKLATKIMEEVISNRYQPATPTFLNAGRKQRGSYVSCYLIEVSDDLNSIGRSINSALQLSKNGGGVALNLSNCRALGDEIKGIKGAASGVRPIAKLYEDSFSYANQLGARQGAGAAYLSAHHLDVLDFLQMRRITAGDEKNRLKTLNIGIVVSDITMELFKNNEDMYMFSPYDVSKKYGIPFADVNMTEKYRELVDDPNIRKEKINARDFWKIIALTQSESGLPYVLFEDTANRGNPIPGKIKMSNLCVEIVQVQRGSVLNDDQTYQDIGRDISCNLGSLNAARIMESEDFGAAIDTAMRSLSWVATHSDMTVVPSIKDGNEKARAVGLGLMNVAGWFAENHIHYGSPEAVEAAGVLARTINYYSLVSSAQQSKETGEVFDGFWQSKYATGEYFDKYLDSDYEFASDKVKSIFAHVKVPTAKDWEALKIQVGNQGLFNQNRLALAPNGSSGYVNHSVPSFLPATNIVEARNSDVIGTVYYPAPGLTEETREYFRDGYQVGWKGVIDVAAALQEHVDQSLSTTLFFLDGVTTSEINKAYYYAWKKGLKTLYYIRTKNDALAETQDRGCVSCEV